MKIADAFGFDKNLVKPAGPGELKQPARRPERSCLDVSKASKELGMKFLSVEEGLKEMKSRNQGKNH